VGDPKQAIYSFRGADIFAYLDARAMPRRPAILAGYQPPFRCAAGGHRQPAVQPRRPFLLDEIAYQPVHAAPSSGAVLEVDDDDAAFTVLWQAVEGDKPLNKDSAARASAQGCAHEIARLLTLAGQDRAAIIKNSQRRPLRGGDIAVLVSTHRQGDQMRQALAERGVPSVALTQESVFASREAGDMLALLRAWAEPASESRLRAALVTELYGLDATTCWPMWKTKRAGKPACWPMPPIISAGWNMASCVPGGSSWRASNWPCACCPCRMASGG
jgi:exodeoxyribonuclease V beta subunit